MLNALSIFSWTVHNIPEIKINDTLEILVKSKHFSVNYKNALTYYPHKYPSTSDATSTVLSTVLDH